jgi:hypothetical protein
MVCARLRLSRSTRCSNGVATLLSHREHGSVAGVGLFEPVVVVRVTLGIFTGKSHNAVGAAARRAYGVQGHYRVCGIDGESVWLDGSRGRT